MIVPVHRSWLSWAQLRQIHQATSSYIKLHEPMCFDFFEFLISEFDPAASACCQWGWSPQPCLRHDPLTASVYVCLLQPEDLTQPQQQERQPERKIGRSKSCPINTFICRCYQIQLLMCQHVLRYAECISTERHAVAASWPHSASLWQSKAWKNISSNAQIDISTERNATRKTIDVVKSFMLFSSWYSGGERKRRASNLWRNCQKHGNGFIEIFKYIYIYTQFILILRYWYSYSYWYWYWLYSDCTLILLGTEYWLQLVMIVLTTDCSGTSIRSVHRYKESRTLCRILR